jgi:hypothetical protein
VRADLLFLSAYSNLGLTFNSPAKNMGRTGWTFGGKDFVLAARDANPDTGAREYIP